MYGHTATMTVVVNITDINDNHPLFQNAKYALSVSSSLSIGSFITQVRLLLKDSLLFILLCIHCIQNN